MKRGRMIGGCRAYHLPLMEMIRCFLPCTEAFPARHVTEDCAPTNTGFMSEKDSSTHPLCNYARSQDGVDDSTCTWMERYSVNENDVEPCRSEEAPSSQQQL